MRPGPLRLGQDFGPRYRVVKLLGSGGMGVVYQALDHELGEDIALKVLRAPAGQTVASASAVEMRRRFRAELVLARKVTHKHVIRIHDIGEIDGIRFISMPFVKGRDLAAILEDGPLPVERALRYARQIVAGLMAVHAAGVVHRDLKPSNIMIDEQDQVLLMDFGIARSTAPNTPQRTMAGAIVGTTAYMAPEQARGEAVDERTDIYGFGLIFYEMLLGPRSNLTIAELMARMKAAPSSARQINPAIPADLDAIVTRCLQPPAADRFQRTADLAAALNGAHRKKRRRVIPALSSQAWGSRAAAAALIAALAGVGYWMTTSSGEKARASGRAALSKAMDGLTSLNPVALLARERESAAPPAVDTRDAGPAIDREAPRAVEPKTARPPSPVAATSGPVAATPGVASSADAVAERPRSASLPFARRESAAGPRTVASRIEPIRAQPFGAPSALRAAVRPEMRRPDPAALADFRPLTASRQDQEVWRLARTLASAGSPSASTRSRLVSADLAVARGDYEGAMQVLAAGPSAPDSWLDRVLLGTAYVGSDGPEAFEEFQVCHAPVGAK